MSPTCGPQFISYGIVVWLHQELPSKFNFSTPKRGGIHLLIMHGLCGSEKATSFQLCRMELADIPLMSGKHEAHVATSCLAFSPICLSLEDNPLKHLLFLSFQVDHISAKNEDFHIVLPLFNPTPIFQYSNKDGRELGRGPLYSNHPKTYFP
eukprot:TRINITY_DN19375_c0_g1_i1.p1 TRINITY_DN19375_c0_g1~~TRINITY_DN19375_c0_g1_i1.p1  ORF type:complete len:152 (+),score=14.41 TRINITY_DN19375_c0_g1_i1:92-547(+)